VERLLVTLADAEDNASQQEIREDFPVLVSNEDSVTWPPWPWPPWDGDDDDEDDGGGKHVNKTLRAHELAKKIVKFERKLAQASLDLCAFNLLISKHLANWHFQRHFSGSNRNVQSSSSV
jgi:endothelin-converting enzyme